MVKVIAHRFVIFRQVFGREPLPSEPIFFVVNDGRPSPAPAQELHAQLAEAAETTEVSLVEIRNLLRLSEPIAQAASRFRVVK
jgi:hypothetical protein